MKKYTVKNWISYCASTLALSGILLLGACGSEENTSDEVYAPETELVTREVEAEEYQEEEVVVENEQVAAPTYRANSASSVNINRLLNEYPDVNQAIRTTLSSFENGDNALMMEEHEEN